MSLADQVRARLLAHLDTLTDEELGAKFGVSAESLARLPKGYVGPVPLLADWATAKRRQLLEYTHPVEAAERLGVPLTLRDPADDDFWPAPFYDWVEGDPEVESKHERQVRLRSNMNPGEGTDRIWSPADARDFALAMLAKAIRAEDAAVLVAHDQETNT